MRFGRSPGERALRPRPLLAWHRSRQKGISSCSGWGHNCRLIRAFVIAFFVRAGDHRARLQVFLDQKFLSAAGAFLGDRFICRGEFALWIITAAVEGVALARLLLHQFAIFAERALHPDEVLLYVLAFGISATGRELTISPVP